MSNATDIYIGEYGDKKPLYISVEYDLTSATSCTFHASASAGTFSATASVLAANYTASACDEVFSAQKAVKVIFASGAFSGQADTYVCWVQADFSGARLISSTFKFTVSIPGD